MLRTLGSRCIPLPSHSVLPCLGLVLVSPVSRPSIPRSPGDERRCQGSPHRRFSILFKRTPFDDKRLTDSDTLSQSRKDLSTTPSDPLFTRTIFVLLSSAGKEHPSYLAPLFVMWFFVTSVIYSIFTLTGIKYFVSFIWKVHATQRYEGQNVGKLDEEF